jgi:hypothetical protein
MNKKLVVFIINPKSGVERVKELKQLILSTLHLDEFDYEIWHTKYAKHGKELAKQAIEKNAAAVVKKDLLAPKELISYDDFIKMDIRVGEIKEAEKVEAKKAELLCDACENDCPICLDTMDITNSITTLCKHSFHMLCLYPMFDEAVKINTKQPRISCPLCRADVFIKSKITFNEIVNY